MKVCFLLYSLQTTECFKTCERLYGAPRTLVIVYLVVIPSESILPTLLPPYDPSPSVRGVYSCDAVP